MAFDLYGSPTFGLRDVKVAAYTATNTYSTNVDVMSAQVLGFTLKMVSATLTGDDVETAHASRPIGGEGRIRFGGVNIAVLEVLFGLTATSSVASPNRVKSFKIAGGTKLPYFGIAGVAAAEEGIGDLTVFIPKCKLMGDVNLIQMEYGNFAIPEMSFAAVDDATFGVIEVIEHETAILTVVVPPANIT